MKIWRFPKIICTFVGSRIIVRIVVFGGGVHIRVAPILGNYHLGSRIALGNGIYGLPGFQVWGNTPNNRGSNTRMYLQPLQKPTFRRRRLALQNVTRPSEKAMIPKKTLVFVSKTHFS